MTAYKFGFTPSAPAITGISTAANSYLDQYNKALTNLTKTGSGIFEDIGKEQAINAQSAIDRLKDLDDYKNNAGIFNSPEAIQEVFGSFLSPSAAQKAYIAEKPEVVERQNALTTNALNQAFRKYQKDVNAGIARNLEVLNSLNEKENADISKLLSFEGGEINATPYGLQNPDELNAAIARLGEAGAAPIQSAKEFEKSLFADPNLKYASPDQIAEWGQKADQFEVNKQKLSTQGQNILNSKTASIDEKLTIQKALLDQETQAAAAVVAPSSLPTGFVANLEASGKLAKYVNSDLDSKDKWYDNWFTTDIGDSGKKAINKAITSGKHPLVIGIAVEASTTADGEFDHENFDRAINELTSNTQDLENIKKYHAVKKRDLEQRLILEKAATIEKLKASKQALSDEGVLQYSKNRPFYTKKFQALMSELDKGNTPPPQDKVPSQGGTDTSSKSTATGQPTESADKSKTPSGIYEKGGLRFTENSNGPDKIVTPYNDPSPAKDPYADLNLSGIIAEKLNTRPLGQMLLNGAKDAGQNLGSFLYDVLNSTNKTSKKGRFTPDKPIAEPATNTEEPAKTPIKVPPSIKKLTAAQLIKALDGNNIQSQLGKFSLNPGSGLVEDIKEMLLQELSTR